MKRHTETQIGTESTGRATERLALTYHEAASAIGVSRGLIRKMVRDGRLATVRLGRSVRIPVAELRRICDTGVNSDDR
jgi:excisionase family DNA binding protein